jgi:uncharacterized protein YlxP (DUF503 family)
MHVLSLRIDLRIPISESLKAKRSTITPIVEGARRRYRVASAEVGRQDDHHRAELGFAAVSGSARQAGAIIDEVERFVWSFPEVEVLGVERSWLEEDR